MNILSNGNGEIIWPVESNQSFSLESFSNGLVYGLNHSNVEIAFHIDESGFGQLKNLSDVAISSPIDHILNPYFLLKPLVDLKLLHGCLQT